MYVCFHICVGKFSAHSLSYDNVDVQTNLFTWLSILLNLLILLAQGLLKHNSQISLDPLIRSIV